MERLLRMKDLHTELDMARSTVANWISNYDIYIPIVKKDNITYYRPEALDVLKYIKECRAENYSKQEIIELLEEKGFPKAVGKIDEDLKKKVHTTDQAVNKRANQEEDKEELKKNQTEQDEEFSPIEDLSDEDIQRMKELKQQLEMLKDEIESTKKRQLPQRKGLLARIFNR